MYAKIITKLTKAIKADAHYLFTQGKITLEEFETFTRILEVISSNAIARL